MGSNKDPTTLNLKREFSIWSNMDFRIKVTCAQFEILNELNLKSI
jgi:hypothetical protein